MLGEEDSATILSCAARGTSALILLAAPAAVPGTKRSRCRLLSWPTCLENWLSGFALVEHSAPLIKLENDMMGNADDADKGTRGQDGGRTMGKQECRAGKFSPA